MEYKDYEDLSDALIWHKQEKRITQERYDELLTVLVEALTTVNGIKRINDDVKAMRKSREWLTEQ